MLETKAIITPKTPFKKMVTPKMWFKANLFTVKVTKNEATDTPKYSKDPLYMCFFVLFFFWVIIIIYLLKLID